MVVCRNSNLAKSIESRNFLSFLNKFEIFLLYETHVIEKKVLFKNYTLNWIPARKTHKSGRAIGGCLHGFKKDVQKHFVFKF